MGVNCWLVRQISNGFLTYPNMTESLYAVTNIVDFCLTSGAYLLTWCAPGALLVLYWRGDCSSLFPESFPKQKEISSRIAHQLDRGNKPVHALVLSGNAKTCAPNQCKHTPIGAGLRFGFGVRSCKYVYNPLPIYFCYWIGSYIAIGQPMC